MDNTWISTLVEVLFPHRDNYTIVARASAFTAGAAFTIFGTEVTLVQSILVVGALVSWFSFFANKARSRKEEKMRPLVRWQEALPPMEELLENLQSFEGARRRDRLPETLRQIEEKVTMGILTVNAHLRELEIPRPPTTPINWGQWRRGLPFLIGLSKQGDWRTLEDARKYQPDTWGT